MQYFKNSICIKELLPQSTISTHQQIEPSQLNVQHMAMTKKTRTTLINFTNFSSSLRKFAYAMRTKLANNRISNVWRIISPKKSRQFSFQLIPPLPRPWPLIIVGIKCSYHLFYVFFFKRARLLGWQTSLFPFVQDFRPQSARLSGSMQIFKLFCATPRKSKKNALWESSTHRGREGDDSQNKWNNYTVRYWIELNMHTYYYLLLLLLLYTLFFIYFEQRNLGKKRTRQINSARWPPR